MYSTRLHTPRAALATALLTGAGLLLPGCSHDKAASGGSNQASAAVASPKGFQVNYDDWAKIGYRLDWVGFPFVGEESKPKVTAMKAYDDLVIVQDQLSTVAGVETSNGHTRWSVQLAGPLTKFVGISRDPDDPGRIIVSSESEAFTISAANGNILNRETFARVVNTQPVLMGNFAIYGTSTGEVLAHYLGRNVKAWGFASVGSFEANPILIGNELAAVSQAGDVVFLTSQGSLVGRAHVFGGLDNNPVTDQGLLFIAGRDQSVWAFDGAGNFQWRYRTSNPLSAQPTAHNGTLYVDIPNQGMTAFEETSGNVVWTNPNVHGAVIGARSGHLLVRNGTQLTTIDPARGDIIERITVPGVVRIVLDKFQDGDIYAVNGKANVAKFIPR